MSLIGSPRFWVGALAGVAGYWLLCSRAAAGPLAFTGGVSYEPKPLRRQGRLLRDHQQRWNLFPFRGSAR